LIPEKEEDEAVTSHSNHSTQYTNNLYTGEFYIFKLYEILRDIYESRSWSAYDRTV